MNEVDDRSADRSERMSSGVAGLDEILRGGLLPRRAYLARGAPGAGKTTLALHFLTAVRGEPALLIGFGEPEARVRPDAASLGFDLSAVTFLDLSPRPEALVSEGAYDIFSPAEVERGQVTAQIIEHVERLRPARVAIDALSHFRYLSRETYRFRTQVQALLGYLTDHGATVLFTSEASPDAPDADLQFLADGVISLGESAARGRSLRVTKYHGSGFAEGEHTFKLTSRGMEVFPRLVPGAHERPPVAGLISSGVPELDELLRGGVARGTITMIGGPSGSGKSSLGLQFMKEAAGRGERSVVYSFEEGLDTIVSRCEGTNVPVREMLRHGTLSIVPIEPLLYSSDEFAALVRREVEVEGTTAVMIDSVAGYGLSLRGEDLTTNLHALCRYLKNMGVTGLLVSSVRAVTGEFRPTELEISYLADNLIFLRFLELDGELRKAIGVLKKRTGDFEKTLREFEITRYGIKVGRPLTGLRGILRGVPELAAGPGAGAG